MFKDKKKVIFLMGSGHCGSTLLDLILGSHSDAFSLGEFNRIGDLLDREEENFIKICGVCEHECEFWNRSASHGMLRLFFSRRNVKDRALSKLTNYFMSPYRYLFKWSKKNILIDSSKKPGWFKRQMAPSFKLGDITPYLIYMLRDGRAVVNSYFRKYPERGMEYIAENWKLQMEKMNSFYEIFPHDRKMKVYYEDLATMPEITVKAICNFMGIKFEKGMLAYWKPEHHHVFGNAGTRSLIFKFRKQFGYQMTEDRQQDEQKETYYGNNYYQDLNLAIKLDQRWKEELSQDQLQIFERIAGNLNQPIVSHIERQQ